MSRALASLGVGPAEELLDLATPSFALYAERHDYELVLERRLRAPERPAPWSKIPLLRELLRVHDLVLWIDADAVVVDPSEDIAAGADPGAALHLVEHRLGPRRVPSTGVLLVSPAADPFLAEAWTAEDLIGHPWYEQAALARLLGYRVPAGLAPGWRGRAARGATRLGRRELLPGGPVRDTPLRRATRYLDPGWNSIPSDPAPHPRIRHYPGEPHQGRRAVMERDLAELRARVAA